ncbi:MAG TPA: LptF/LptG family permease [Prolixibacteraceae bacterium]|nr:LptF/LptG family permease [Prolixibacteraceae bacterium]HPS13805.1 LptF/LptG family permease [Prolixibacteraceae bacterium]
MKRLYSYILERFIGPFVLTFFVCVFVLLMQFLWRYLDDLVGKGLETSIIIELMSYAALSLVPMAFPLSVLMASIITFGNMGERLELFAIKASGVSLLQIMKPLIIFNLVITLIAFVLADQVIPVTNTKFATLLWSVKQQRPEMIIKEGAFSNDIDGYSIKVNKVDQSNGALLDIMIYDHTQGRGNTSVILADSGFLNMSDDKHFMILTLFRGESYSDEKPNDRGRNTYPFSRERFGKEEIVIGVKDYDLKRANEDFFKDGYRMLKNRQLTHAVDSLNKIYKERVMVASVGLSYNSLLNEDIQNQFKPDSMKAATVAAEKVNNSNFDELFSKLTTEQKIAVLNAAQHNAQANQRNIIQADADLYNRYKWMNRHAVEWHRKYTLSLACLLFFLVGAPLGAIIRKGGFGLPIVVSILLFIFYYIISMICENMAKEGVLFVGSAMWFSSLVLLVVGLLITYSALTDSVTLNRELYSKLFDKFNFLKFMPTEKTEENNEDTLPVE